MVSIIIPIYNVEKYIKRCVDSLLNQSFIDLEIILVDDESPDNCGKICDEYTQKDKRVKVIHKKNGGVSSARNAGLDMATGEYIMFCDADDYVRNDWVENLHSAIVELDADFVASNWIMSDDNREEICCSEYRSNNTILTTQQDKYDYIMFSVLTEKTGWAVWTRIFKAKIIKENKIYFCESCENFAEDLDFVLQCVLYSKKVSNIDYAGYYYYQRSDSMMNTVKNNLKLNALNEVSLDFANHYYCVIKNKKLRNSFPILHFVLMYTEYSKALGKDWIQILLKEIPKIKSIKWYNKQSRNIIFAYRLLKKYYGKDYAIRIIMFSFLCSNRNVRLYSLLSGFYYKYLRSN